MNRNRKLLVAGVAATTAIVGSGAGIAIGAASSGGTHTLKFNSVLVSQKSFSRTHFGAADKDISNGKRIGNDVIVGVFHPKTKTFSITFAGGLKNGFIYGAGTGSATSAKFSGTVTGGTGGYKGVTGTIKGQSYGKGDNNEHLTITYK